jgi:hypothetical protein
MADYFNKGDKHEIHIVGLVRGRAVVGGMWRTSSQPNRKLLTERGGLRFAKFTSERRHVAERIDGTKHGSVNF